MRPFCSCGPEADGHSSNSTLKSRDWSCSNKVQQWEQLAASWTVLLPWPASTDIYHLHPKHFHPQKLWVSSHSTQLFDMTRTHAKALVEMLVEHKKKTKQKTGELKQVTCRSNAKSSCWNAASWFSVKASVLHGLHRCFIKSFRVRFLTWCPHWRRITGNVTW